MVLFISEARVAITQLAAPQQNKKETVTTVMKTSSLLKPTRKKSPYNRRNPKPLPRAQKRKKEPGPVLVRIGTLMGISYQSKDVVLYHVKVGKRTFNDVMPAYRGKWDISEGTEVEFLVWTSATLDGGLMNVYGFTKPGEYTHLQN